MRNRKGGVLLCGQGLPRQRRWAWCGPPLAKLCDAVVARGKTCDRPMGLQHVALHVEPNTDYCAHHVETTP